MSRVIGPTRVRGVGSPFTNWRFDDAQIGTIRRPISETPPAPSGYTPQVMMVM